MINLIKNECIKLGILKLASPFVIMILLFITKLYFYKDITIDNLITFIPYIGIILCIIFSGIISNEIESGTFRYYLTKSKTRTKVLFSKILMMYTYIFLLCSFLLLMLLTYKQYFNSQLIIKYYIYTIPLYFIVSLCTLLSVIIKNTPIITGICIILLSFCGVISELLFKNNIKFIEYTFMPYLDFSIFMDKESISLVNIEYGIDLNIYKAIIFNVLFIIIFNISSYLLFKKKDIKC